MIPAATWAGPRGSGPGTRTRAYCAGRGWGGGGRHPGHLVEGSGRTGRALQVVVWCEQGEGGEGGMPSWLEIVACAEQPVGQAERGGGWGE